MEIKILELRADRARIVLKGEGHTFLNLLIDELLNDPSVDVARYLMEFQYSDPELLITTDGKKGPIEVLREACGRITGHCEELLKDLKA